MKRGGIVMNNKDQLVEYLQHEISINIFCVNNYEILKLINELITEFIDKK